MDVELKSGDLGLLHTYSHGPEGGTLILTILHSNSYFHHIAALTIENLNLLLVFPRNSPYLIYLWLSKLRENLNLECVLRIVLHHLAFEHVISVDYPRCFQPY